MRSLLSLSLAIAIGACGGGDEPEAEPTSTPPTSGAESPPETDDGIRARLGCDSVTEEDYQQALEAQRSAIGGEPSDAQKEQLLHDLIELRLVLRDARQNQIAVSEETLDQAMNAARTEAGVTEEQFAAELERQGIPMDAYRAMVGVEILRAMVLRHHAPEGQDPEPRAELIFAELRHEAEQVEIEMRDGQCVETPR